MAATVENRVVSMEFDNKDFERNVATSISTLDALDKKLKFDNAGDSFDKINQSASKVNFESISSALDKLNSHFSVFGIASRKIIEDVVGMAENAAAKMWNATIGQVMSGGWTRASNIEQAKFQLEGLGIAWSEVSDAIDYAVKDTAYGLDSAAKAAGQLAASGVQLGDDMKATLRGISGVAAMSSSTYDEIAMIYESAAGKGRIMNMELTRLSQKGINATAILAKQMGITEAEVRDMASKSQISFQEFAQAMDDAYGEHAKEANKTFSGVVQNIQAALSRIGANFATPIMTDMVNPLNQLRIAINNVNAAMSPVTEIFATFMHSLGINLDLLGQSINSSNIIKNIVEGLGNILAAFTEILYPIGEGFAAAFPEFTIKNIEDLTERFLHFAEGLMLSDQNIENIRNTSEGFFSIISGGIEIISNIAYVLSPLLDLLSPIGTLILEITGNIGQWISEIVNWMKQSEAFNTAIQVLHDLIKGFADTVGNIILKLSTYIGPLFDFIAGLFTNFVSEVGQGISGVNLEGSKLKLDTLIGAVLSKVEEIIKKFVTFLGLDYEKIKEFFVNFNFPEFSEAADKIKQIFEMVATTIGDFVTGVAGHKITIKDVTHEIATALVDVADAVLDFATTVVKAIDPKKIKEIGMILFFVSAVVELDRFVHAITDAPKMVISSVTSMFKGVSSVLNGFSLQFKADALIKAAEAIGILAIALFALAQLPGPKLLEASAALIAIGGGLDFFCERLVKVTKEIDAKKLIAIGTELLEIGAAILLIAIAVRTLSSLELGQLGVGLAGLGASLIAIYGFMRLIENVQPTSMAGLIALGITLDLLIPVLNTFANFNWPQLAKAELGIAGLLTMLLIFSNATEGNGLNLIATSAGLVLLAAAIDLLVPALLVFALLPIEKLKQGIGALALIATGLLVFTNVANNPLMVLTAAGLVLLAAAIDLLLIPIVALSLLPIDQVALGVSALCLTLLALAGTAALISAFAAEVIVGSVAIGVLAAAIALAGVGVLAFSVGLAGLIASFALLGTTVNLVGPQFSKNITDIIVGLAKGISDSATQTAQAFLDMVMSWLDVLAQNASAIINKVIEVVIAIGKAIVENAPKILHAIGEAITGAIKYIIEHKDEIIEAAKKMWEGFIEGIKSLASKVWDAITEILLTINDKIFEFVDDIKEAAAKLIGGFIDGILGKKTEASTSGTEVADGLIEGMEKKTAEAKETGADLGEAAVEGVCDGADTHSMSGITFVSGQEVGLGEIMGMKDMEGDVEDEANVLGSLSVDTIGDYVDKNMPGIGKNIPTQLISGMGSKDFDLKNAGMDIFNQALGGVTDLNDQNLFFNQGVASGNQYKEGIDSKQGEAATSGKELGMTAVEALTGFVDGQDISGSGRAVGEGFDAGLGSAESGIETTASNLSRKLGEYGFANVDYAAAAGAAQANAYKQKINQGIVEANTALERARAREDAKAREVQAIRAKRQAKQAQEDRDEEKAAEAAAKKAAKLAEDLPPIDDVLAPTSTGGGGGGGGGGGSGSGTSKTTQEVKELFDVLKDGSTVIAEYQKRYVELNKTIDENVEATEEVIEGTENNIESMNVAKEAVEKFAQAIFESSDEYTAEIAAMDHSSQEYLAAMKEAWDGYKQSLESALVGSIDAFSQFTMATHMSSKDILDDIYSQITGINLFDETIRGLAESNISPTLLKDLVDGGIQNMDKLMGLLYATDEQREAINKAYETLDDVSSSVTDKIMASLAQQVDRYDKSILEVLEDSETFQEGMKKLESTTGITSHQVVVMFTETQQGIKELIKSGMSFFDEYEEKQKVSKKTLQKNLEDNKKAWEDWGNAMNEVIAKGLDLAIVDNLKEKGLEGMGELQGFMDMTTEEIQKYNETWGDYMQIPDRISAEIAANYTAVANKVSDAYAEGINSEGAEKAVAELADNSVEALKNALGDKGNVQGSILSKAFDEGFKSNAREVYDTVKEFGDKVLEELEPDETDVEDIGYYIMKGLAAGIKDNSWLVTDAIEEVMDDTIEAAQDVPKISSPSKVFMEIGRYIDEGLAIGINDNARDVTDSVEDMGYEAINSMQAVVDHILEILEGTAEMDPTIRPVVDMSDVEAKAGQINSIFAANPALAIARGINVGYGEGVGIGGATTTNTYSTPININIYSNGDPDAIADAVQNKINHQMRRLGAVR